MKKNILVFCFLFFILMVRDGFCQNPLVKQWDYRFGGIDREQFSSFQQTEDGGYILGGFSESGISGDKTHASWGNYDYWVVKTDALGNKQWDKDFGGTGADLLYSLQQTSDGGYILGGHSFSGISGDKTQATWGTWDYWIVKIDSLGNKQWDNDFGGTDDDRLFLLHQTADRGYILGGYSSSGISGNKTQNTWGSNDYWIVKTDSLGNKLWDKDFGGTSYDALFSLQQTADGGFILGGFSFSDSSGDKTQPTWDTCYPCGDYWIVKIDSLGNKQWDKDFGGTDDDRPFSLQQTADGGYIIGGYSWSGISGDKTQALWGESDYWIVKTDSLGNKQWDKDFGGTLPEEFSNIFLTDDGGYLFAGDSYSSASGNKTENNLGTEQTWIIKTDSLGNMQWDKTIFTMGHDENGMVIQTNDGCFVVANMSNGGIGGYKTQPIWDTTNCSANCEWDYWIIKFCDTTLTTSISNISPLTSNFNIFPNPANDFITISFTQGGEKNESVGVYDLFGTPLPLTPPEKNGINKGELLLSKSGNMKIDISDFIPGVYIVEIKTGNDYYRKKIIKM